jgi:twitching motility protein PilT
MAKIDALFDAMLDAGASDLHLSEGQPPKIRQYGNLVKLDYPVLTAEMMRDYLEPICPPDRWQRFQESRDLDFAYTYGERARYRTNYFCQAHGMGAVFRTIPTQIRSVEDLGMPAILKSFCLLRSGLVLVTGPTGSGKSTTLAAIIDLINRSSTRHILTIEEPIEFVHPNKQSIICQREVGIDVNSFTDGLRIAGRQDCDVILVGEMRDYETISLAISAAAMGTLVFGTLHTNSAVKTVDRVIDAFPAAKQSQVRAMLADSLRGVCSQLLLRTIDGIGRLPATEVLLWSPGLANSIREGNTPNVRNLIQGGRSQGMHLMDDSIQKLFDEKRISAEEAHLKATDKARFERHLQAEGEPTHL